MTAMLEESLQGEVFSTGPYEKSVQNNLTRITGKRHETLHDAESFFCYRNQSITDFEKIFCVIRNPYELELSRYTYLRKGAQHDSGLAQDIAMQGGFTTFLRDAPLFAMLPPRLHLFLTMANQIPENLVVLRFERLTKDIETYMSKYLESDYQLPLLNKAEHASYRHKYIEERELLCFNKHRFFFEKGFYSREVF